MKTRRIFLLLILGVFLTSCIGATGCMKYFSDTVVFAGDSVTLGVDSSISYVDIISSVNRKIDCKVVAKAGGQVADSIANFHKIAAEMPYCVVIMYGLNDMKNSRTVFRNNLSTLVSMCMGIGADVVICTPSPHMELQSKLDKYAETALDVAYAFNCEIADVNKAFPKNDWSYMATVNHPNEEGHELIASIVGPQIP